MTTKEFKEHQFTIGEPLYVVLYKYYEYIVIPYKVKRTKVCEIANKCVYVYDSPYPYCHIKEGLLGNISDLFFTRKEAEKRLAKKKDEFIKVHRDRIRKELCRDKDAMRYQTRTECAKINKLLRMKIMNE